MNITTIRLTRLLLKLRENEHFLQKRLTLENLSLAFREKRAVGKLDAITHEYFALCILWPTTDPHFFELGTLWVDPAFQGKGRGRQVFLACVRRLPKGAGAFLITREMKVLELARSLGWQLERSHWCDSQFWTRIAEPWERQRPGSDSNGALLFLMP